MSQIRLFLIAAVLIFTTSPAFADKDVFITPSVAIGHNEVQGTHTTFGLDIGMHYDEHITFGVGGYLGLGEHPEHDRETGVGPFVGYSHELVSFLTAQVREDIDYVDANIPIKHVGTSGTTYTHENETGVVSATSLGLHLKFTPNFGISGGYRIVIALSNEALDDDRSGYFLGLTIGI